MIIVSLIKGALKLVAVRKTNKGNVARIYDPREAVPEAVFPEIAPNLYENQLTGDLYTILDNKMVAL